MDNDNKELTNKARKRTQTQSFGASKREGHDSTKFYNRKLYNSNGSNENAQYDETPSKRSISKSVTAIYANDIVQIDLTIIAGLVIFLVLTSLSALKL